MDQYREAGGQRAGRYAAPEPVLGISSLKALPKQNDDKAQSQDAAEIVHEQMERLERQLVEERVKVALIRGSVQPAVSGVYGLRPTPAANRES